MRLGLKVQKIMVIIMVKESLCGNNIDNPMPLFHLQKLFDLFFNFSRAIAVTQGSGE